MQKKTANGILLIQKIKMIQTGIKLDDPIAIAILNRVGLYEVHKVDIAVSDILKWRDIGSAATIHGRVLDMTKRNLLTMSPSPNDRRVRYVTLAPLTIQYFTLIGEAMAHPQKNFTEKLAKN